MDFGDIGSSLTDLNPFGKPKSQQEADAAAQQNLAAAQQAYGSLTPAQFSAVNFSGPAQAANAVASPYQASLAGTVASGPTAMNNISVNPQYAAQQAAQMSALSNLAANGGHNAASDAALANIQNQENQNARGNQQAIMQSMDRRGMGGSGASLLAQLSNSQNATNNQSLQDLNVLGQEANTALAAGSGAANIGSNLQNQSFNEQAQTAAANDAINRFNAQQAQGVQLANAGMQNQANQYNAGANTGVSEFNANLNQGVNNLRSQAYNQNQMMNNYQMPETTYQNAMGRAAGMSGANLAGAGYFSNQANQAAQKQGNLDAGIFGIGGAAAQTKGGQSALGEVGLDNLPKAAAAFGGRVPGMPMHRGDSPLNDFVNIKTSPGEVVVPRSLVKGGNPQKIGQFVKKAPLIGQDDKNKEAMLSALKHLGRY